MFEKYDGVRAFWNVDRQTFFSRTGKPFLFPSFITQQMPSYCLDGELWFGRNSFQQSMQLSSRRDPSLIDWTHFSYQVVDIPTYPGSYQHRYSFLALFILLYDYFKLTTIKIK